VPRTLALLAAAAVVWCAPVLQGQQKASDAAEQAMAARRIKAVGMFHKAQGAHEALEVIPLAEVRAAVNAAAGRELEELLKNLEGLEGGGELGARGFAARWNRLRGVGVAPPQAAAAGPRHENSLGMRFLALPGGGALLSVWEARVADFEVFVAETGHDATVGMLSWDGKEWKQRGDTWKSPGFKHTGDHPVVGVSWEDAVKFCEWLTEKERREGRLGAGQKYRLPTDAEWSRAAGGAKYRWGNEWPPRSGSGNFVDEAFLRSFPGYEIIKGYDDGHAWTSPVGLDEANWNGYHDLAGNVWEWCEDWYRREMNSEEIRKKYPVLDNDNGGSTHKVLRGGSWYSPPDLLLASFRNNAAPGFRNGNFGFRLVLVVR